MEIAIVAEHVIRPRGARHSQVAEKSACRARGLPGEAGIPSPRRAHPRSSGWRQPISLQPQSPAPGPGRPNGVDELKSLRIEFQDLARAAQRNPEFLVELLQRRQIGPCIQLYLIEPTHTKEFPGVIPLPLDGAVMSLMAPPIV